MKRSAKRDAAAKCPLIQDCRCCDEVPNVRVGDFSLICICFQVASALAKVFKDLAVQRGTNE